MKNAALDNLGKVTEDGRYLEEHGKFKLPPNFDDKRYAPLIRTVIEKPISYYDEALKADPQNEEALANKSLALVNLDKKANLEEYFLECEMKGNWSIIKPTDNNYLDLPAAQNWQIYRAMDNTSCEIHFIQGDGANKTLKFKNGANILVTSTRVIYFRRCQRGVIISVANNNDSML